MTIQWHTSLKETQTQVSYRIRGEGQWLVREGLSGRLDTSEFLVHTVELEGLEADGDYEFRLGGNEEVYRFRTLPRDLSRSVKFVVGGDAYYYLDVFRKMNARIAATSPDFVVVGGDIAYTNGTRKHIGTRGWQIERWRTFLKQWKSQLITKEGRLIPLLAVLGNHDIRGSSLNGKQQRPLFYELFALPEKGIPFRTLDCGNYLSLFLLDTGHGYNISGQQTQWLSSALASRENRPYKFAAYHIGAYPSAYPYRGTVPKLIRKNWVPIFERYHLQMAFEHHNHAFKRTFPLKKGKVDPDGVLYLGDGSWGVNPRQPKQEWYLEKAEKTNAVWVVTLEKGSAVAEALNLEGKIFDCVKIFPTRSETIGLSVAGCDWIAR